MEGGSNRLHCLQAGNLPVLFTSISSAPQTNKQVNKQEDQGFDTELVLKDYLLNK